MRVLMIGPDRGIFGKGSSGDVITRHQKYADMAGSLDVVVFASSSYKDTVHGDNFRVFSTRSSKQTHWRGAIKRARELSTESSYDLIVCQELASPAGKVIRKELNVPLIVSIHSMFFRWEWLKFNPTHWYLYWKIRSSIHCADAFRVTNEAIEDKIHQWGITAPTLVQPTPVDIKKFLVRSKPKNPIIRILYVGRLSPEKNVGMLIRAASQLPAASYQVDIVGDGPERKKLERLATGNDGISFLGSKSHDKLADIYKSADIFVLPSNTESFGKVLVEAGAAGCVLVATKTAGAKSIIEYGENGLFVEIGNRKELAQTLERLIKNRDLVIKLGKNAQDMAKLYDSEQAAKKIVDFWKQIAQS